MKAFKTSLDKVENLQTTLKATCEKIVKRFKSDNEITADEVIRSMKKKYLLDLEVTDLKAEITNQIKKKLEKLDTELDEQIQNKKTLKRKSGVISNEDETKKFKSKAVEIGAFARSGKLHKVEVEVKDLKKQPISSIDFNLINSVSTKDNDVITTLTSFGTKGHFLAGNKSGGIELWSGEQLEVLDDFGDFCTSIVKQIADLGDSEHFVVLTCSGGLYIISVTDLSVTKLDLEMEHKIIDLSVVLDGRHVYLLSESTIYLWDTKTAEVEEVKGLQISDPFRRIVFINDALLVGCYSGAIYGKFLKGKFVEFSERMKGKIFSIEAIEYEGIMCAAVGGVDSEIAIYDPFSGTRLKTITLPEDNVTKLIVNLGCEDLLLQTNVSGSFNMIKIDKSNESTKKNHVKKLTSNGKKHTAACYLGDGRSIIIANEDGVVDLWRTKK